MSRPEPTEYHEYYGRYISLVPDGPILDTLVTQMEETQALLASVPADRETFRYAPGKWSLREVVGHLVDVERAFAFRGLWIARGGGGQLPSFEQDQWAADSNAGERPLADLAHEWAVARDSHVLMFGSLSPAAWTREGIASGNRFTTRAFPWIVAGHELYHRRLIRRDYLGLEG